MDSSNAGTSGVKIVTRRYLYDKMQQQDLPNLNEKLNNLENYLLTSYGDTPDNISSLKQRFAYFKTSMKEKWSKAHRKEAVFLKTNEDWLSPTFELPTKSWKPFKDKSFKDCSERTKRRRTEEMRSTYSENALVHAANTTLQAQGKRNAAKILRDITNSPTRARKYRKAYKTAKSDQAETSCLTPLQALSMCVEADLTKRQYEIIRNTNKSLYPCYDLLVKAKKECYPPKDCIRITSTCAESSLQSLIDNTITRLSIALEEILCSLSDNERNSLKITCKWGCDGSQQAKYKQRFEDATDTDSNMFLSSFVPLRIIACIITCGKEGKKIKWQNPTPSSPRCCRPIRFRFVKESVDITKEEICYVENAVRKLTPTEVILQDKKFIFEQIFKMTMVDGNVCNAATDTKSTSKFYICGATSKDFNNLTQKLQPSSKSFEFGLSVLHARIRLFESVLHLAYKLPLKKYRQKRSKEEKELEAQRKEKFGNTHDGNTSRRFFENPQLAADITKVDFNLIYRLKVILETISSGHKIDTQKFDEYAMETARLYCDLYSWHPMTPTMHKILIHGAEIIENALLPIGQLSEEAAEARNKHFRLYRESYARKFSREHCNLDVYNRLLLSSDPLLSSMRRTKKSIKARSFCPETINMLLPAEPNTESDISEAESEE